MTQKKRKRGNRRIAEFGVATRFKPGQSGNPGGRPKTRILAEMLSALGNEVDPETLKSYFQIAAERLMSEVFRGNVQAFREFADRIDGRSTQHVELAGGLQVQHGESEWVAKYHAATPEEREQMTTELDDKILARAEKILARRLDTPENRARNRINEFNRRTAAGENPAEVLKTLKSPEAGLTPVYQN
ncbi:MAG: DUF5681 domain-containing protein [Candidatus Acidiferrales bacterium]